MSQRSSVKKPFLPPTTVPSPRSYANSVQKSKQSPPRNPLQALNRISGSSNCSSSSRGSAEAPRGCLSFFLSHSSSSPKSPACRSKHLSRTPNSIPSVSPLRQPKAKENLRSGISGEHTKSLASGKAQKVKKNPSCLNQWQSGKKSGSSVLNDHHNFLPRLSSAFEESKIKEDRLKRMNGRDDECSKLKSCYGEVTSTPLSKIVSESHLDIVGADGEVKHNSDSSFCKTPPIQISVSPEIQCDFSSVSATTPACYSAGYIVSGVSDKRKCRPRGTLIVGEGNPNINYVVADSFDDDNGKEMMATVNNDSITLLPHPSEASMYWVSSPHNEGDKHVTETSENEASQVERLVESTNLGFIFSPSTSHRVSLGIIGSSDLSSAGYCVRRKATSISPGGLPEFQGFSDSLLSPSTSSCKEGGSGKAKVIQHNPIEESSPFSVNSLSSGNVIQTPKSDFSSDIHVGMPWVHEDHLKKGNPKLDLDSIGEVMPSASFMSVPLEDSVNSNFQFDCSTLPCDSFDLTKLPKFLDDQVPWLSSSTIETASQSQMRISWREGLMNELHEIDDFDCYKCLSDEEDFANDCNKNNLLIHHSPKFHDKVYFDKSLDGDVKITETEHKVLRIEELGKEIFQGLLSCSRVEYISTDGTGVVASRDDPDWMSCYKNTLFED